MVEDFPACRAGERLSVELLSSLVEALLSAVFQPYVCSDQKLRGLNLD